MARSSSHSTTLSFRETSLAFGLYLALTIATFWPTVSHLTSWIVGNSGDGDNLLTVWQLWWFRLAISTGQDPAFTHNVFALYPTPVAFFVENFFTEAVALPLQSFCSALTSYNVLVLSSFVLGGTTAYALASEFIPNKLARFAAGFIYAFSTYHFFRAAGHLGEVTMEWMPFFAWRLLRVIVRPTVRNALLATAGLALVPLSEVYYGPYFVIPFSLAVIVYLAIQQRTWFTPKNVSLLVGIYSLGAILAYFPLRSFFKLDPSTKAATAAFAASSIVPLSADLTAFFLPSAYNPVFGRFTAGAYAAMLASYPIEEAVYLGLTALFLSVMAILSAARGRAPRITWFWLGLSVFGILLALGPILHVAGRQLIFLPFYKALFGWSVLSSFRAPNRLVVLPLLGVAMLAGIGLNWILHGLASKFRSSAPGRVAVAFVLAASFAESLIFGFPYPAVAVTVAPIYSQIGLDRSDTILLDLPILTSGYYQMLQIFHKKRLVDGYTSRMTPEMEASVLDIPSVSYFVPSFDSGINLAGPREVEGLPKDDFRRTMLARNIHYVVFHKIVDPDSAKWANAFLTKTLGSPMDDEPTLTVWHF